MKAIRMHAVGGPDVLCLDEIETPEPDRGEVLVKVEAAGVTYGDVMKRQGAFGEPPLPAGLGLEVAGTVVALGAGVTAPPPGTRVMARVEHGYAEYAVASAAAVLPVPDGIDLRSAAGLPVHATTAYQTLHDAGGLRPGESVLVHAAAGGVGGLAVQLAQVAGAETVIGTAGRPRKLEHIRDLGAIAVDYTGGNWPEEVLETTAGRGVDLVLDSVGGATATRSVGCLAPLGRMVSFGAAGGSPAEVPTTSLMHGNLSLVGYSLMERQGRGDGVRAAIDEVMHQLTRGRLDVTIGKVLPLEEAERAHRDIAARDTIGTTVLLP